MHRATIRNCFVTKRLPYTQLQYFCLLIYSLYLQQWIYVRKSQISITWDKIAYHTIHYMLSLSTETIVFKQRGWSDSLLIYGQSRATHKICIRSQLDVTEWNQTQLCNDEELLFRFRVFPRTPFIIKNGLWTLGQLPSQSTLSIANQPFGI